MQLPDNTRHSRLNFQTITPTRPLSDIVEDARQNLLAKPSAMPPKYFYDQRGSELFDAICDTREYYPTRTEEALLRRHAQEIIHTATPQHIIEFGSGTSRKTRHLLDACDNIDTVYWPFDVCEAMLKQTGEQLVCEYEWLDVNILVGDYLGGLQGLPVQEGACLYLFLGGTIGNFTASEASWFLNELSIVMKPDDYLLLGADRIKDSDVLHAAYNDKQGITADFNLNLLKVLNRELEADFNPDQFEHKAEFNADAGQIEMYLESSCNQSIEIARLDAALHLQQGERILTEISRKFTQLGLEELLAGANLLIENHLQPANGYFSLVLARKNTG
jgi:L-histidine N-alpha-methyltransferase